MDFIHQSLGLCLIHRFNGLLKQVHQVIARVFRRLKNGLLHAPVLHDGDHLLELRPVLATEPRADLRREGIVAQYHARLMAISLAAGNTTRAIRVVDSLEVAGVLWRVGSHDVASSRRTAARLTVSSGSGYRSNSSGSRHIRGSYW